MTCEEVERRIADYLYGSMEREECADYEQHLLICDKCHLEVEDFRKVGGFFNKLKKLESPKKLKETILQKAREQASLQVSPKVRLEIVKGQLQGRKFVFTEHDTFLFGRTSDCHICLPDDPKVSRHHFILEVNPPNVCICDLGSLNGTYINGVKYSYGKNIFSDSGFKFSRINLKDNDDIRVGDTIFR